MFRAGMCAIAAVFTLASSPAQAQFVLQTAYQDLPPKYVALGDGRFGGLCYDIMARIDDRLGGVQIESPGFRPWKRIQADLATGDLDLVFGMARSAEREERYIYVDTPLYAVKHVAVARATDAQTPADLEELVALNPLILTNKGSATARWLRAKGLEVDDSVNGLNQNIDKLLLGRGQYVYFHDLGLTWALRQREDLGALRIAPGPFRTYAHFLAFSRDTPDAVVTAFADALARLAETGELARIRREWVAWPGGLATNPDL